MRTTILFILVLTGIFAVDGQDWPIERLENFMLMQKVFETNNRGNGPEKYKDFTKASNEYVDYLCNTNEIKAIYVKYKYDRKTETFLGGDREAIRKDIESIITQILNVDKEAKRLHQKLLVPVQKYRDNVMTKCMGNVDYANAARTAKEKGWDLVPNFSPIILYCEDIIILGMHPK